MTSAPTQPGPRGFDRLDVALGLALALAAHHLYRASAPAQVNLDGLGYLKLLPHNFSAGHLLYMPLLRAVTALRHGDALLAGRQLGALCAAASVGLCYAAGRALGGRLAALIGAAGLAVSYGVWAQGSDVEAYAPALLALLVLFALLLCWRAVPSLEATLAVGLALAVAVLTHVTHVLAVPLVVVWMALHGGSRRRGAGWAALAVGTGGAIALGCYAYAGFAVRRTDATGLLRWVSTAQHGFRYEGGLLGRVADGVYGLARSLVWSPYLHESNAQTLLGQFVLGLAVAAALAAAAWARLRPAVTSPGDPAAPPASGPLAVSLVAWVIPYAAMALAFFGSDHERWLFVLPPLWMAAGAGLARSGRGAAVGVALIAVVAGSNWHSAVEPGLRWTWDRTRADAATEPMRDGDLVIFPGHSWDEYVGFHSGRRVIPLPVSYYAGVAGKAGCLRRIEHEIRGARRRGARVFAVRLFSPAPGGDDDQRGFYELAQLGLERADLERFLGRWAITEVATSQPTVVVHRLDEPTAARPGAPPGPSLP